MPPPPGGFAPPPSLRTLADVLDAMYAQRVTGAVPLILHLKNGVAQAVDVGQYDRIALTPGSK